MSERKDFGEFVIARKRWMESGGPVTLRELSVWLEDLTYALERIRYFQIGRAKTSDARDSLLEVTGVLKLPSQEMEYVRLDFEKVFRAEVAKRSRSIHSFRPGPDSLAFSFCCVSPSNEWITGTVNAKIDRGGGGLK